MYSKEDKMTHWEDVVGHTDMARMAGWDVEAWRVEGTPHCGHFRGNEEAYRGRMKGMWEGRKEL